MKKREGKPLLNLADAQFEASAYTPAQLLPSDLPEIVFSGRSNVGKSSMINKLLNRKSLARISSAPGKTASVNFYRCGRLRLVDLPGYGFARVSKEEKEHWSQLVDAYFGGARRIALVIQLIDLRHAPSADDLQMIDYLAAGGAPFAVALTKSDKLGRTELEKRRQEAPAELGAAGKAAESLLYFSAKTGLGADALKAEIETAVGRLR